MVTQLRRHCERSRRLGRWETARININITKSEHMRPVQYRAHKQAADPSVGRLLTRAVLYRCPNVARFDLDFCEI